MLRCRLSDLGPCCITLQSFNYSQYLLSSHNTCTQLGGPYVLRFKENMLVATSMSGIGRTQLVDLFGQIQVKIRCHRGQQWCWIRLYVLIAGTAQMWRELTML